MPVFLEDNSLILEHKVSSGFVQYPSNVLIYKNLPLGSRPLTPRLSCQRSVAQQRCSRPGYPNIWRPLRLFEHAFLLWCIWYMISILVYVSAVWVFDTKTQALTDVINFHSCPCILNTKRKCFQYIVIHVNNANNRAVPNIKGWVLWSYAIGFQGWVYILGDILGFWLNTAITTS